MTIFHNSSTRRSIFVIPLLIAAVYTLAGFSLIDLYFNRTLTSRYETDLARLAHAGSNLFRLYSEAVEAIDFDQFADTFSNDTRFRVTLIDASGTVLGDSRLSRNRLATLENHADRPEVMLAAESGMGTSVRHSSTLNIDLLYVAVKHSTSRWQGFFRVAMPLDELAVETMQRRIVFAGFGLIALLGFSIVSLIGSRFILSVVRKSERNLEQRVDEKNRQIDILQSVGNQLTVCSSFDEGLAIIKHGARALLPGSSGSVALFKASKDKLEILETWNGDWKGKTFYHPDHCWAMRTGRSYFGKEMICQHSMDLEKYMVCIPLVAQGVTYGVMHFYGEQIRNWTEEEKQLAFSLAENASLTFSNLDLRENLKHQAIRDPLTGLYNRRYLIEVLEKELSRASRKRMQIAVLMIDLDFFKKFNDEHGHDAGDFILSEFGRIIRSVIRDEDIPCRYGGEEFTIVLPETDRIGASLVAEKIRKKIRSHDFSTKHKTFGKVTLSIGGAIFPDHGDDGDILIKKADEALYKAKKAGRDRVVLC